LLYQIMKLQGFCQFAEQGDIDLDLGPAGAFLR
jgi:hypothetical protein